MNAKAFGRERRDFALSFRWGKETDWGYSFPLFVDEFRVCCGEVLDFFPLRLTE
jgi:hypothetical protein